MKFLFFVFTLLIVPFSFSQKDKIKIEKDIVYQNDAPVFKLDMVTMNNIKLKSLDNKELAYFKCLDYYDSKAVSSGNPKGRIVYFDVTFFNQGNQKCEIPCDGMKKWLARYILEHQLMEGNELNQAAVDRFVAIHGTKFSEDKNRSTTIIIVR